MLKCIFWIQVVLALGCEVIAVITNYLIRPLANFDTERAKVEGIMAKEGHFDVSQGAFSVMHYFITALHAGGQVNFWMLQISCIALFFGGVIGLQKLYRMKKTNLGE